VILKIRQAGEPVLRQQARPLSKEQILSPGIQDLIGWMRETMRDAPGVGLAAPQIGVPLQLAVIEDRAELLQSIAPERLAERRRKPVPFQTLINPRIELGGGEAEFFEGCLSVAGFSAVVARALEVRVECLDHRGEPCSFTAEGWHARIVQHETDHLRGGLYIDCMRTRTFMTVEHLTRYWADLPMKDVLAKLGGQASQVPVIE
jgi:peptide deformylase